MMVEYDMLNDHWAWALVLVAMVAWVWIKGGKDDK